MPGQKKKRTKQEGAASASALPHPNTNRYKLLFSKYNPPDTPAINEVLFSTLYERAYEEIDPDNAQAHMNRIMLFTVIIAFIKFNFDEKLFGIENNSKSPEENPETIDDDNNDELYVEDDDDDDDDDGARAATTRTPKAPKETKGKLSAKASQEFDFLAASLKTLRDQIRNIFDLEMKQMAKYYGACARARARTFMSDKSNLSHVANLSRGGLLGLVFYKLMRSTTRCAKSRWRSASTSTTSTRRCNLLVSAASATTR